LSFSSLELWSIAGSARILVLDLLNLDYEGIMVVSLIKPPTAD